MNLVRKFFILLIKFYQKTFSLVIGNGQNVCRFYPNCSEYAIIAIEKKGVIKGGLLILKRLAKCNPYSEGGYDSID